VKVVAVRASDFYGPDVPTSVLSEYGVARLIAQRAALVPYSPDFPHDFTYVPDFARALVTLADAPNDAYGQAWNVPNAPTRSLRELLSLAAKIAGVPMRIQAIPAWLQPLVGIFQPAIRELTEMRFQTDRPYRVDARSTRDALGRHVRVFRRVCLPPSSTTVERAARSIASVLLLRNVWARYDCGSRFFDSAKPKS